MYVPRLLLSLAPAAAAGFLMENYFTCQNNLGICCSCSGSMGKPYVQFDWSFLQCPQYLCFRSFSPCVMFQGQMLICSNSYFTQQETGIAAGQLMLRYKVQLTFVCCLNLRCLTLNEIIIATKRRHYDEVGIFQNCRKGLEDRSSMMNQVVWVWDFFFWT